MLTKKILSANTKTPPQCAAEDEEAVPGKYHYVLALLLCSFIGNSCRTVSEPGRCAFRFDVAQLVLVFLPLGYCTDDAGSKR